MLDCLVSACKTRQRRCFRKVKIEILRTGGYWKIHTAGEKIEILNVERRPYQFLYKDDMGFNFMHNETFEQISLNLKWLKTLTS